MFILTGGTEDNLEYAILLFKVKGLESIGLLSLHELDEIKIDLSSEKRKEIRENFNKWIKENIKQ